jgi:hypothetical protein
MVSINYILLKDGARRKKENVRADIPRPPHAISRECRREVQGLGVWTDA